MESTERSGLGGRARRPDSAGFGVVAGRLTSFERKWCLIVGIGQTRGRRVREMLPRPATAARSDFFPLPISPLRAAFLFYFIYLFSEFFLIILRKFSIKPHFLVKSNLYRFMQIRVMQIQKRIHSGTVRNQAVPTIDIPIDGSL